MGNHRPHRKRLVRLGIDFSAFLLLSALTAVQSAAAQTCSPQELLSIARAGAACAAIQPGQACYGSGSVSAVSINEGDAGLAQPGDRAALHDLSSVRVMPDDTAENSPVSIATLAVRLSPRASDVLTVLLLHEAEVVSEVIPPVELLMTATGALPVRSAPSGEAAVISELAVNNSVLANGRTADTNWLRVTVPSTGAVGWVSSRLVSTQGSTASLPVVTPGDSIAQPFQIVRFDSGESAACGGALSSGALLQTPSTDLENAVSITLNGISLRLAGTAFLTERGDSLIVVLLDGIAQAGIGEMSQLVPAGAQITVQLDADGNAADTALSAVPYEAALAAALPTNNLPRRFQVTPSQRQDAIDAVIAALTAPEPTPVQPVPTAVDVCRRSLSRDTTVWAGPGIDYEALTELEAGTTIRPVRATRDAQGAEWWQLHNSGWVARAFVSERGDCSQQEVPVVVRVPPPPHNTYSMERCESLNGPVRSGQRVTFEFIPPAWDNYGAARDAVLTDPGSFIINSDRYRATASDPLPLGTNVDPLEDRYLRRFTLVWTAQPGTYRITGDWLTYEPSCNLTVPVE